jgi:cellulose synthase/poly-beta-1,6-N-acetylglucosamine synthase-like glycosyltransferase
MNIDWPLVVDVALVRMQWAILVYFMVVNGFYAVLLLSAVLEMRRYRLTARSESRWRLLGSPIAPRVSMIAPAFNEEATVSESVRALLALHYPSLEVVLVNDGSRDGTVDVLRREFDLVPVHPIYRRRIDCREIVGIYHSRTHPSLVVIDKKNGGKADALNAGLNVATGELVCAIDADTLIEADALPRMVRPFLQRDDIVAAGGTIRIANGSEVSGGRVVRARAPRRAIPGFQSVEYLRAFLFGRLGWNRLGGNLIISGAFGLFRRDAVLDAGGYVHDTVGEDMELVLRLRRLSYENGGPGYVQFVPDPVAWTEAPETLRVLGRQRDRWHRGLADVLWRHRRVMLNPKYGSLGFVAYPYFLLVELFAPVIEAIGIITLVAGLALGVINVPFAVLFFLVAYGIGAALTCATLVLEELSFHRYDSFADRLVLLGWALTENIGYRQLTVIWRLQGIWKYLRGSRSWGAMERRGFGGAATRPGTRV